MYHGGQPVRHSHGHHGQGHANGLENRLDTSMPRDRTKERQEARAQREKYKVVGAPAKSEHSPVFGVVRNNFNNSNPVQDVLGNFEFIAKNGATNLGGLMGVEQQPATPAPPSNAQTHDPDTYLPPPPPPPSSSSVPNGGKSWQSSNHRSSSNQVQSTTESTSRLRGPHALRSHHPIPTEDVKLSLKGPGPGGGPGPQMGSSKSASGSHTKARHNRDPQVSQIMNEINDVKTPLTALLQTPRPDHQFPFAFPPVPPLKEETAGQDHLAHQSSTHSKSKSGRISDSKSKLQRHIAESSSVANEKSSKLSDKEDPYFRVPDSSIGSGYLSSSGIPIDDTSADAALAMANGSLFKSSEESSEDSSCSGSDDESSSSDEEGERGKDISPQSVCNASDMNQPKSSWNLYDIFQQDKDESPPKEASKNSEMLRDLGDHAQSPHNSHEPAPSVSNMMPNANRPRRTSGIKVNSAALPPNMSEDDSPGMEARPSHGKQKSLQKASLNTPSHQYRRDRHSTKRRSNAVMHPSSDSEEEEIIISHRRSKCSSQKEHESGHKRNSNKNKAVAITLLDKHTSKKRLEGKRSEALKSDESINAKDVKWDRSLSASDSDSSIDVINSSPEKCTKRASRKSHHPKLVDSTHTLQSPKGFLSPIASAPHLPLNNNVNSFGKKSHRGPAISASPISNISLKGQSLKVSEDKFASRERSPAAKVRAASPNELSSKKEKRESQDKSMSHRAKQFPLKDIDKDNSKNTRTGIKSEASDCVNGVPEQRFADPPSASPRSHQTCPSPSKKGLTLNPKVPLNNLHYENGIPKIVCSIPLKLIDRLPHINGSLKAQIKKEKLNKEVLEMRTSSLEHKSPSSEDNNKTRAIITIYKRKKQSSLEPDRIKKEKTEVAEPEDTKIPLENLEQEVKDELQLLEPSPLMNASSPSSVTSNISSSSSHRGKHKKEKKEKSKRNTKTPKVDKVSALKSPAQSEPLVTYVAYESTALPLAPPPPPPPPQQLCPDNQVPKKRVRERDISQDSTRGGSKQGSSQPLKKLKQSSSDEKPVSPIVDPAARLSPPASESVATVSHSSLDRPAPALTNGSSTCISSSSSLFKQAPSPQQSSQYSQRVSGRKSPPLLSPVRDEISSSPLHNKQNQQSAHYMEKTTEDIALGAKAGGKASEQYPSQGPPETELKIGSACSYGYEGPYSEETATAISSRPLMPQPSTASSSQTHPELSHQQHPLPCGSIPIIVASSANHEDARNVPMPGYFISNFEKPVPPILHDYTEYTRRGKEKKYSADEQTNKSLKVIMYLEAVIYFILSGVSMEMQGNNGNVESAFKMYTDTQALVRYVYQILVRRDDPREESPPIHLIRKLRALSLRCQSLLHFKLYTMKWEESKELEQNLSEYCKNYSNSRQSQVTQSSTPPAPSGVGGTTPNGNPNWPGSQRCPANNSPSSLSPTPSPANSVGSDGSQSSGYTTSSPPRVMHTVPVPVDVHSRMIKHFRITFNLTKALDLWREADLCILHSDIEDFFINLDHFRGSLIIHSSLQELVAYMSEALVELKKHL